MTMTFKAERMHKLTKIKTAAEYGRAGYSLDQSAIWEYGGYTLEKVGSRWVAYNAEGVKVFGDDYREIVLDWINKQ